MYVCMTCIAWNETQELSMENWTTGEQEMEDFESKLDACMYV